MARRRKRKEAEEEATFAEAPVAEERQRLTPVDVQEKVFRLAFRGYSERDVDEFLDRITEDLAALHEDNKRLREQLAEGGPTPGVEDAERQAEAIVREAREHAARLVEEAEAQATDVAVGAAEGAGTDPLPTAFLLRERQFLQQMAALIQDHARRLKEEARRAGTAPGEPPETAVEASPAPGPATVMPSAESSASEPAAAPTAAEPPPPPAPSPGPVGEPTPEPEAAATPIAEPVPERSIALPEAPEERTAPWTQVDEPQGSDEREEQDPLLSAWESAFTAEGGDEEEAAREDPALHPSEVRNRKDEEGEPSLRELFWGDEG